MEQSYSKKNIWVASLTAGLLVAAFVFFASSWARSAEEGDITGALQDLSTAIGQEVVSQDQAVAICDSEKYFEVCADVGKKYGLYSSEESKQVDTFIAEIRGAVAEKLKNCQTTECLIGVANELAKKVSVKDPKLAESFELTSKFVERKQAVIQAAKEQGVDYDACRNMDPDTAEISLLRACAKLAKDSRVKEIIPAGVRAQAEQYGDYADKSVELRSSLQSGEFKCGDGSLEGCGDFCLNPGEAARAQGSSVIPPVCRQIAQKFFGADGVKQLEAAYSQVQQTQNFYKKKSENILFTTIDGRTLTRPEDIGNYMEAQGRQGNVEAVEKGMDYMVSQGFIQPKEKEFALKYVKRARDLGGPIDFDKCSQNPDSCREFIPEDHRSEFEAGFKMQEILRQELGFDPRQCQNSTGNQDIGQKCFEASKRALPQLESFASQSPEIQQFVSEIKSNVGRAEQFNNQRGQLQQAFQQSGGGPGGCKSEQECRVYCSDPLHGPECISFGAKQGISGFQGTEAVEKFQQYNQALQRPQFGGSEGGFFPSNQGYPAPGGFQGQGSQQGFPFPGQGQGVPGGFPGQGYPVQGGFPGGQRGFPSPGGPVGPSPECFAAIQSGDFAKAKVVCSVQLPVSQPLSQVCPSLPTVDSCPVGEIKVVSYSSPDCGVFYACKKEYVPIYSQPAYTPYPYPTGSYAPYPTGGNNGTYCPPPSYWDEASRSCRGSQQGSYSPYPPTYSAPPSCPSGQWWDYARNSCQGSTTSYSPYPTGGGTGTCTVALTNLLGSGCHWMYTNVYCDGPMTKSAKEGDTTTTAGCTGGTASYSPYPTGGTYSPYPSGTPTSSGSCPSGSHTMYVNNAGGYCMSDADATKCGPLNSASASGFGSCSTYQATYSPYPSGGSYTPYPTCTVTGQWWDPATSSCKSSSTTYTPYPSPGTCPAGQYWYWPSTGAGYCKANETPYPYPSSGGSYTPYPTCTVTGQWWDPATSSCRSTTTTSYSPAPTYSSPPSCPSGQWWDYASSSCQATSTFTPAPTYTAYPTSTYTYTPAPTTDPSASCTSSGGTWNGSSCVYPTPVPTTSPPPSGFNSPQHQMAMARTIMACVDSGGTWKGISCESASFTQAFFGNILKIFSRFIK